MHAVGLSYLEKLGVSQSKLLDDLRACGFHVWVLTQEGYALVIMHLDDLVGVLLGGNGLGGGRQLQLLNTQFLECNTVLHEAVTRQ